MSKTVPTLLYQHKFIQIPQIKPGLSCDLEQLKIKEISCLIAIRNLSPFKIEQFQQRLERGDICYVASHDGQPVHFSWLQTEGTHPISPAGRSWPIKPGEAWIYDCRTADWAQRQGIYPFVLTHILRNLKAESFSCAWIYTSTDNIASQKGINKAGFQLKNHLYCIEFAGRVFPLPPLPW